MSRARNWCFTLNNWTETEYEAIKEINSTYIIIGKEVGDEGTPHLQGYIELDNAMTMSALKKKMPRAHLEISKGNAEHNTKYCSKGKDFYTNGNPKKQGKRSDIDDVRATLKSGANMRTVVETAASHQSIRMAEIYLTYHEEKRDWLPIVKWYWGATGTGKTRQAYADSIDPFTCGTTIKWWQGYDKHQHIIIDDFRTGFCTLRELLRLLDRYPFLVECKGSSRQLLAKQIIITAPHKPDHYYGETGEDINQLLRRIGEVREFTAAEKL